MVVNACGNVLTFRQVHETGFFSVIGTGLTEEEVQRQYNIGQAFFDLPAEEKDLPQYKCDFTVGNYFGYRAVSMPILGELDDGAS